MKFAAIQLDTIACEVNINVHKALNWGRNAFEQGAKYIFFHEGLTADYTPEPMRYGRSLESAEVYGFSVLAKKYDGYLALGLNEIYQGRPYISMVWIGPEGVIGVYRKSYLWPNPKEAGKDEFNEFAKNYVAHEQGYRMERGILAAGSGTTIMQVGSLRIGCIICADGSRPEAWETFEKDRPDLVFWQNNRGNVSAPGDVERRAQEMGTPMIATNRCGYSWHHFQAGGTLMAADNGTVVAKANEEGKEEMIFAEYKDLKRL